MDNAQGGKELADNRKILFGLLGVVLLAALLRWIIIPGNPVVSTDSCDYLVAGKNLMTGKGFTSINGFAEITYPPLFPAAVGLLNLVVGNLELAGILTTLLFGILVVPSTFLLAWLLFRDRKIAMGSALLVACHPRMIELSVNAISEAPYICLLVCAISLFVYAVGRDSLIAYIATGFVLGLVYLTRAIGFFYMPLLVGGILIHCRCNPQKRSPWLPITGLVSSFAVVAFPYIFYLHSTTGVWSISPDAANWWAVTVGDREKNIFGSEPGSMSNPLYHGMLNNMIHQWQRLLVLMANSFYSLFVDCFNVVFPPWFFWPALIGLLCLPRKWPRRSLLLVAMFLPLAVQCLYHMEFRYLFPLIPIVALWVPTGIDSMSAWIQKWVEDLRISPGVRLQTKFIATVCWVVMICLLLAPTLVHAFKAEDLPIEHKQAGLWIKEKWGTGKVIMSRKPWVSFYSGGIWHAIPHTNVDKILEEVKRLKVEFLVIDERFIPQTRPQLIPLLSGKAEMPGLEQIYRQDNPKKIRMYRVPPLPKPVR